MVTLNDISRLTYMLDLDVIMVPAFLHAATMQCMAASTCEHGLLNLETGEHHPRVCWDHFQDDG